jgi:hypothetical protein
VKKLPKMLPNPFLSKIIGLCITFSVEKSIPKIWTTFEIVKQRPKENNRLVLK